MTVNSGLFIVIISFGLFFLGKRILLKPEV